MCLVNRKASDLSEVSAFKIFTRDGEGQLQSVFKSTFKKGLAYAPNERIRVDKEDANFFAFEELRDAIWIAREGRRKWNMVGGELIVLPVTLFDVSFTGKYYVPSDDIQCVDGYWPAFEAKGIIVHDTPQSRDVFHLAVLEGQFRSAKHGMSMIDKKALLHFIPSLAETLN